MLLGVLIMLVASVAYNSAPILLRAATRALPARSAPALLRAVLTRRTGLAGLALNLGGWGLEVAALTLLPLTLARSLLAAGLVWLLVLARWELRETISRQELLGVLAIVGGIAAVSLAPPARSVAPPSAIQWAIVLLVLGPVALAPYALRAARRPAGAIALAVSAGVAYALSALFSKELANVVGSPQLLALLLALAGATVCAVLGFTGELGALRRGEAAGVAPVYRALQILIPIACAPLLFGERWPADAGARSLLAGGLLLTLAGIVLVSYRHDRVVQAPAGAAS